MSIFFDKKLSVPPSAGTRNFVDLKWHRIFPLLAFIVDDDRKGGLVSIYDHSKDETEDVEHDTRLGLHVTSISWHPISPLLAIGYDTGEVIIWNEGEGESFEGAKNHVGSILIVEWSHCGTLLVSADSFGSLVIWICNSEGHVQPRATHDFKDAVSQLVFRRKLASQSLDSTEKSLGRMTNWRPKTGRREKQMETKSSSDKSFFVGLLNGAIFYLRDNGSSEEVLTSGSSVKYLLYHQLKEVLIVMTDASILGQFSVDESGGLSEVNKVKISGRGDISLAWAGVGILAILSEELSIRLIDIDRGDNFILEPRGSEKFSPDEHIASFDYNEKIGYLFACTNKGKLVIWRETSVNREINGENSSKIESINENERWEWFCTVPIPPTTKSSVSSLSNTDLIALNGVREVVVLRQQEIAASYEHKVSIIQNLATQLMVHLLTDNVFFNIDTDIHIRGFTNSSENISIWSGAQIETYEFGKEIPKHFKFCGSFNDKSESVYLFEKSIYVLESHQIQVRNFQGTIKQTLTFSSDEGAPLLFSGSGEYLVAATSCGYLKIWHIGGREGKIHAPSKNLKEILLNFSEVILAKNNPDGTKVAFTIAKKDQVPDSRLYIWEILTDSISSISFPSHFVTQIYWDEEHSTYAGVELKILPPHLRTNSDDENIGIKNDEIQNSNSSELLLTDNKYLLLRTEKNLQKIEKAKYEAKILKNATPSLDELEKCISELDFPRRKQKYQKKEPGPWNKAFSDLNAEFDNLSENSESEKKIPKSRTRPLENSFLTPDPLLNSDKNSKKYKKPMLASNPNRRRRLNNTSGAKNNEKSENLQNNENLEKSLIHADDLNKSNEGLKIANDKEGEKIGKKSKVINLKSKKKVLDLAGFGKRDMNIEVKIKSEEEPANQVITFFICSSEGFLQHEKIVKVSEKEILLGVDVPYCYFLTSGKESDTKLNGGGELVEQSNVRICRRVIPDFKGVENESGTNESRGKIDRRRETKNAMLNYVYHHLSGDIDRALAAMENIQSNEIWRNMAKLCLSSKRVDVASICFARMKNIGACRALRMSIEREDELDAQVAIVALQLDLIDEAEELLTNSRRYDLLVPLLASCNCWTRALSLCESHYRIQLKSTYYSYAKYLEEGGEINKAVEMYEKSGTYATEVPRVLHERPEELEAYVIQKKEKELYRWWAQYLESIRETENAAGYYELASDWFSLTRLLCYSDQLEKAVMVAESTKDRASSYYVAGILNDQGRVSEAVRFYEKAEAYGHGMRICKENEMDEVLYNLSHLAHPVDQLDAAQYFENKDPPELEKAIRLYHKSGYSAKAMNLAFSNGEFSALQEVARDLLESPSQKDPEVLERCAEFFVANQEYARALDLFASAKKYSAAMDVCVKYNISIDEEMAERLTAKKEDGIDGEERRKLLEKMAECCMSQGSYQLAAKKFTQAGKKESAMKVLLKSGDISKIIQYANISRHRDIYLMGANYLQTTPSWSSSPQLIETILSFYTKAKMPHLIMSFYESWAQSVVELHKNYASALEKLKEAQNVGLNVLKSEPGVKEIESALVRVGGKIKNIDMFLGLKEELFRNPSEALAERLREFASEPSVELSVNLGDIFGTLVEFYVLRSMFEEAVEILVEMRQNVPQKPSQFIRKEILEMLNSALGSNTKTEVGGGGDGRSENINFEHEENIEEDGEEYEEIEEVYEIDEDEDVEGGPHYSSLSFQEPSSEYVKNLNGSPGGIKKLLTSSPQHKYF